MLVLTSLAAAHDLLAPHAHPDPAAGPWLLAAWGIAGLLFLRAALRRAESPWSSRR